jgi:hypothetical protein
VFVFNGSDGLVVAGRDKRATWCALGTLRWRLLPVWRATSVKARITVAHVVAAIFSGSGGMQADIRCGFLVFVDYDGGATEGYQSDQVIRAIGQLRRQGVVLEEQTRGSTARDDHGSPWLVHVTAQHHRPRA